ncbi:MAG: hypothetical protein HQL32_15010 [Planctomycetes bacterium]|nr:hypothetical protein [Planctomycetota bacterium]
MKRQKWLFFLFCTLLFSQIVADTVDKPILVEAQKHKGKRWYKYKTNLLSHLKDYKKQEIKLSRYGGRMDNKEKATGFYYTKKLKNSKWIVIDPDGYPYLSVGLNGIKPGTDRADTKTLFPKKYGNDKSWAKAMHTMLFKNIGLTTLGLWSDDRAFHDNGVKVTYTKGWSFMANYGKRKGVAKSGYGNALFQEGVIPAFDPEFKVYVESKVKKDIGKFVDDPWLFGYFTDNELPLKKTDIIKNYLKLPADDHGHKRAKAFIKEKKINPKKISSKYDDQFCEIVLSTYFKTVHDVLRKYDKNHMVLGTRFHGGVLNQDVTFRACGPYVDIFSVNYYHRWSPTQKDIRKWGELTGKPMLVSEFYAKGKDTELSVKYGAGFLTKTQKSRGQFYENFVIGLLQNKNVIGWHWHRYIDDGIKQYGSKSSNKGYLDVEYNEWKPLTDSVTAINSQMYTLRDYLQEIKSDKLMTEPTEVK